MTDMTAIAKQNNGDISWSFDQSNWEQIKLRLGTGTAAGICWAAVIAWLAHDKAGIHFKDIVGSNGSINSDIYKGLIKLQSAHRKTQDAAASNILADSKLTYGMKTSAGKLKNAELSLCDRLSRSCGNLKEGWAELDIRMKFMGGTYGHVTGLKIKKSDYRLFDPNSGEYTFPGKTDLMRFVSIFFAKKYTMTEYTLKQIS